MIAVSRRRTGTPPAIGACFRSPIAQGLQGYWGMSEGGGILVRDAATHNEGTFTTAIAWVPTQFGVVPQLASSGFITVPHSARLDIPGAITIAAWVYWISSTEAYNSIVSKEAGSQGYTLMIKSNGKLAVYLSAGGNISIDGAGAALTANIWNFVVATFDGATIRTYINGALDASQAGTIGSTASGAAFLIGKSPFGSGRLLNANVGPVGVWNRALSPSEIGQLYADPHTLFNDQTPSFLPRLVPSTVLSFTFPMVDSSGNAATGLTVTCRTSIDGAALAASANAVVELSNGWYRVDLTSAEFAGTAVGLKFSATGAKDSAYTVIRTGSFTTMTFPFALFDTSGDPKTGATVTAERSQNGSALASCDNPVSELSLGWYKIALTANDLNHNNGMVSLRFSATGARDSNYSLVLHP